MKKTTQLGLLVMLFCTLLTAPLLAQNIEKEAKSLVKKYEKAYNNEDVKALISMYTSDAVRSYSDGMMNTGSAEIEAALNEGFAGSTTKLSLEHGTAVMNADGSATITGMFTLNGTTNSGEPIVRFGTYTNTLVMIDKDWLVKKSEVVVK